jgi:hypothetical protein
MKNIFYKIKPASGIANFLHLSLNALLPVVMLIFIRLNFEALAALLILLSKWRIFSVKPRYWVALIRSNLVDIFIGLSVISFMSGTNSIVTQIVWMLFYIAWLVWLKQKSNSVAVMGQALLSQALALVAFYRSFPGASLVTIVLVTWLICYASARHFLGAFPEPLIKTMTEIWAWFGAVMAWILGHWVIEYFQFPQIAIILTILGYGFATLYYLDKNERLKPVLKQQLLGLMIVVILIVIIVGDWQDKTI